MFLLQKIIVNIHSYNYKNLLTKTRTMKIEKFEDLSIWQEGKDLAIDIYKSLKDCRDFSLRDQMQKAAISVTSNIAEGFERSTNKDFTKFLYYATGSCGGLRTQLIIAKEIELLNAPQVEQLIDHSRKLSSMTHKFINSRKTFH